MFFLNWARADLYKTLGNLSTKNRLRDRFLSSNSNRLLDRFFQGRISDRKAEQGFTKGDRTCDSFLRHDRVPRQNPVLLEILSKFPSPVIKHCFAFLSKIVCKETLSSYLSRFLG